MDISDAFVHENIESAGVMPTPEELDELQKWLDEIVTEQYDTLPDDQVSTVRETLDMWKNIAVEIAITSFHAGRAYQQEGVRFPMEMDLATVQAFISFLARGQS